tara:strand:+ start:3374 stop:3661 length:288 start_codon:yes stop_codon:yes gene_type:complete
MKKIDKSAMVAHFLANMNHINEAEPDAFKSLKKMSFIANCASHYQRISIETYSPSPSECQATQPHTADIATLGQQQGANLITLFAENTSVKYLYS